MGALLPRQARRAGDRRRPAGVHRAGCPPDLAPRRYTDGDCSARSCCRSRRIHRGRCERAWRASSNSGRRSSSPRSWPTGTEEAPLAAGLASGRARAGTAVWTLHRLSGKAVLHRHEAGAAESVRFTSAPTSAATVLHLPPFNMGNRTMGYGLGPAGASALQPRGGKRAGRRHGRWRLLAQRPDEWHRQCGLQPPRRPHRDHRQRLLGGTGGQDILSSRAPMRGRAGITRSSMRSRASVSAGCARVNTYDIRARATRCAKR